MSKTLHPTNEEVVMREVAIHPHGISDLECSFKHWINSPRTYISDFERRTGLKLWHNQIKLESGKFCTFYTLPDLETAKKIIRYLNRKALQRNEIAITPEQEQEILSRFEE